MLVVSANTQNVVIVVVVDATMAMTNKTSTMFTKKLILSTPLRVKMHLQC